MKVEYLLAACPFVKVIDILGYNVHVKIAFQLNQSRMSGVWHSILQLSAALIVKLLYHIGVSVPGLNGCYLLYLVLFPQPAAVAECFNAALGAHPGACQYYQFLHDVNILNSTEHGAQSMEHRAWSTERGAQSMEDRARKRVRRKGYSATLILRKT